MVTYNAIIAEYNEKSNQAWQAAVAKVEAMSNAGLLTVWKALGTNTAWADNHYNEYISLDEWANLIYGEKDKRGL